VEHQVAAAVQALLFAVTDIATDRARRSIELERTSETGAARRMKRASYALEAAMDVLGKEYRKR
jgi:hypothetical protein